MFRAFLALLTLPHMAWGHAGDILDSLDVALPSGDTEPVLLESSIGALWANDGENYKWLCHEAVTQPDSLLAPRYAVSPQSTLLAALPKAGEGRDSTIPMYRSTDLCDWTPVAGLEAYAVVDVAYHPQTPDVVYAVANHPEGLGGNGVFQSLDDGQTWTITALQATDRTFRSLLVTEQEIWATAVNFSTQQGWLYRSQDAGLTWDEVFLDLSTYASPPDVRLGTLHDGTLWFTVTQTLEDQLWSFDGNAATLAAQAQTKIMNTTHIDSGVYVALWNEGIARWNGSSLEVLEDSPKSYAIRSRNNQLYAATRPLFTEYGLMTSNDGVNFQAEWAYSQLLPPPQCPPESDSFRACDPLWETLAARLLPPPVDTGEETDTGEVPQKSCGSNKAWLVFCLPLGFFRRFHRTQHRP